MTQLEKVQKIAENIPADMELIVRCRHRGKYDGANCYFIKKNKIISIFHQWNCEANMQKLYNQYVIQGR